MIGVNRKRNRTRGVCYFNHGTKHLARFVFSLHSLRKHYSGPVTLLDTGTSGGVVEKIASDRRLTFDIERVPIQQLNRNTAYVAKAGLWEFTPYSTTILLDADTLPVADPSPLFERCEVRESGGVLFTRFADWVTTGTIVSQRIERWRGVMVKSDDRKFLKAVDATALVEASLADPHPAINTGVVAFEAGAGFLRDWKRLTEEGRHLPFTDELAAQLLLRRYAHAIVDDRWNCSPIYGKAKRAAIWHAHGSKHLTRADGRGKEGHPIWMPVVEECWRRNLGRLREWAPAGDGALEFNLQALKASE